MGWKLRKDKLRADTDAETQPTDTEAQSMDTEAQSMDAEAIAPHTAVPADQYQAPTDEIALNPVPGKNDDKPVALVPFDLDQTAFVPLSSVQADTQNDAQPLHLDTPEPIALSSDGETEADAETGFDPLSFPSPSDLDDAPVFAASGPVAEETDTEAGMDDAPVFGLDSVLDPEINDDASVFAMGASDDAPVFALGTSGEDPLPDDVLDAAPVMETPSSPIALTGDSGDTSGAFAPYQPEQNAAQDDAYDDPTLEVGATAFDPQSPELGTFSPQAPTAGEELASDTTDTFADASDTSPLSFEPSFEAPDALAGEAAAATEVDPNAPFMDRDALAAGLVSMQGADGLPRVAPFVLSTADSPEFGDEQSGPYSLTVRLGSLSAIYPLAKPVTTIGRPDTASSTYPDIEVELDDGVSRHHAEIRLEDDTAYLVDVGSTNGTLLNGERLPPNQPARLIRGDRIRIGERVEMVFE